jgi:hypothetical protein
MPRLLIGDGFDFEHTTTPTTFTEAVTVKFRPPTRLAVAKLDQSGLGSPEQVAAGRCEFLAAHLGEWNVDDGEGKPVPITAETFAKVRDWQFVEQLVTHLMKSEKKAADDTKK